MGEFFVELVGWLVISFGSAFLLVTFFVMFSEIRDIGRKVNLICAALRELVKKEGK